MNQGKNFDVMRTMYSPQIVSVEGDCAETKGQGLVIEESQVWQGNNQIHSQKLRGPFFNSPDQFAVHFSFEVTRKATGKRVALEEVGLYTVANVPGASLQWSAQLVWSQPGPTWHNRDVVEPPQARV